MNVLSLIAAVGPLALHAVASVVGVLVGVLGYRYLLVKNPGLLNTLVTAAGTDIQSITTALAKKAAVLPTAVPVAAAVAAPAVVAAAPVAPAVVYAPVVSPVPTAVPVAVAAPTAVAAVPVAPAA